MTSGICAQCNQELAKNKMAQHLKSCSPGRGKTPSKTERRLHVVAQGRYAPDYWLHVDVHPKASLEELDSFLRQTWLECCGHLSEFEIQGRRFVNSREMDLNDQPDFEDKTMEVSVRTRRVAPADGGSQGVAMFRPPPLAMGAA